MKVLIQGAGIAGLTLAAALKQRGIDFLLVEKAPELRPVGAGITLGSNALLELANLIDLERLKTLGEELHEMRILDQDGKFLMSTPSRIEADSPHGLALHRHHLHESLLSTLPPETISFGTEIHSFTEEQNHYNVTLTNGVSTEVDYIIGADGLNSSVRRNLFPGTQKVFSGYTCWRSVVEYSLPESHVGNEIWGSGRRMGLVPISSTQTYLFVTLNVPFELYRKGSTDLAPAQLVQEFSSFHPLFRDVLLKAANTTRFIHNDLEELTEPIWGKDHVILIGDAAHAMTPNLGQGAAMGIEDAVVLAELLDSDLASSKEAVLANLKSIRHSRVEWVAGKARELGRIGQLEGQFKIWARNHAVQMTPAFIIRDNVRQVLQFRHK